MRRLILLALLCLSLASAAQPVRGEDLRAYAFGDSITHGTGASDLAHSYIGLLSSDTGWAIDNRAVSGNTTADQAGAIYGVTPDNGTISLYDLGVNDVYQYQTSAQIKMSGRIGFVELAWLAIPASAKVLASDPGVTYSGAWTPSGVAAMGRTASAPDSTATFGMAGPDIILGFTAFDQTRGIRGRFAVYVDGRRRTVGLSKFPVSIITRKGSSSGPIALVLNKLGPGLHTIVIRALDSGVTFDWAGRLDSGGPRVYVGNVMKVHASPNPKHITTINRLIAANVKRLRRYGLRVSLVDLHSAIDPLVDLVDRVHPNDAGHAIIARHFEAVIASGQ